MFAREPAQDDRDAIENAAFRFPSLTAVYAVPSAEAQRRAAQLLDMGTAADPLDLRVVGHGYMNVEFGDAREAAAFQERIGELDSITVAIGSNGPRLAAGHLALPTPEMESARARWWDHIHSLGFQPTAPRAATTVVR